MNIHISQAALSLVLGIVILIQPKFLAWIIALWLIVDGLIGLGIIKF
ncbi:MAG: DUF3096 domain-containing protein [Candidatus Woesebacteria bacterium]